jgi:tripartite ATP-independent transporter DctM subunit
MSSVLFLWLIMLGAVVALRRSEHMFLSFFIEKLSPSQRRKVKIFAETVVAAVFICLIFPAWEHFESESYITTPTLGLSGSWRAGALLAGFSLLLLASIERLATYGGLKVLAPSILVVLVIAAALWAAETTFRTIGNYSLLIFFVGILGAAVIAGVPIAFSFSIAAVAYVFFVAQAPLSVVVSRMDEGMASPILLAAPMFILLGSLIVATGMARAMVHFLATLLGHLRGGLMYVLLAAMYLVSGISGSKAADMAAIAPVLFPEMKARGSKPGELVALLSASGAMAETIPPSLVLIILGSATGVSIAALFTGGLLPALVLAFALVFVVYFRSRDERVMASKVSGKIILKALAYALPGLVLPFIIRTAVVEGVATATEVSTIGLLYVMVAGVIIYREFNWRQLYPILVDTTSLSAAVLLILGAASAMAWALTQSGFSARIVADISGVPGGSFTFMLLSIILFAVLGSFLEGLPAIVLFGPLLFPISRALGIHDVHYAMVVILAMGIGLFSPPLGVGYYAACAIGRVDPIEGMKPIWPYMAALLIGLLLVAAVPWISIGFL